MVRLTSIRTVLAYAVQENLPIHQMDVVTAFLNGELEEDIYMEQPEGYVKTGKEDLVCRLKKSLCMDSSSLPGVGTRDLLSQWSLSVSKRARQIHVSL